ncbi:MAG TPA: glycine oxidase ThiO [Acidimicrobiales bacterium]|nr:glycine oxidase ThiO [Acidimicrobiales bacterium]
MERFDVAIIGSGVIGLATAWRLAAGGRSVALVDPHPGRGASYAAAGMLAPVGEAAYGEEPLIELNVRAADGWAAYARELEAASGQDVGFEESGTLLVGYDASDRARLQDIYEFQRGLGLPARWCSASECRRLEPALAPGVHGGVLAPHDHRVDNRRLVAALAEAGRRSGVRAIEARADAVLRSGATVTGLLVEGEELVAGAVVLAAGHASSSVAGLEAADVAPVRPVKGQILRLRARDGVDLLTRTVHGYVQGFSVYLVPRTGGRLVLGATVEERGEDDSVTAGGVYTLLRDATRMLPALDELELVEAVARFRPGSPDNAPVIGPTALGGLVVATGHYRNGILLAPLAAEAVEAVLETGTLPAWAAPFAPGRFAPARGGPASGATRITSSGAAP